MIEVVAENGRMKDGVFQRLSAVASEDEIKALKEKGIDVEKLFPNIGTKTTIQWKELSGVWVPIYVSYGATEFAGRRLDKDGKKVLTAPKYRLTLDIDWEWVNQDATAMQFSLARFGLPLGTPLLRSPY